MLRKVPMAKPEFNAVLLQRIDLNPYLAIFKVAPCGWSLSDYRPGQFAVLGLPGATPRVSIALPDEKPLEAEKFYQRAYSIASSPKEKNYLEFYVTLVRGGLLTPRLFSLKAGDPIYLGPKITGAFTMDEVPADANIVLIATGTGIAPFNSMLRTYLKPNGRKFALFHGVRESGDLGYRSEMELMEQLCPNFSYHPTLSQTDNEKIPWTGSVGYVQKIWESGILEQKWGFKPTAANTHLFLCGSPAMIESMVKLLESENYKEHKRTEPGQIHVERYW